MPYTEQDLPERIIGALKYPLNKYAIHFPSIIPALTNTELSQKFKLAEQANVLLLDRGIIKEQEKVTHFPYCEFGEDILEASSESVTQKSLRLPIPISILDRKLQLVHNLRAIPSRFAMAEIFSVVAMEEATGPRYHPPVYFVRELFLISGLGPCPILNWNSQKASKDDIKAVAQTISFLETASKELIHSH